MTFVQRSTGSTDASPEDDFWALRGKAIQEYAMLEHSLFNMFYRLAGMDMKSAGVIFFRVVSTRARNAMIEDLYRQKFGDEMNLFRNSLLRMLRCLDEDRNKIVHWCAVLHQELGPRGIVREFRLEKPQYWDFNENSPYYTREHIGHFISRCHFLCRVCYMFAMLMIPAPTSAHSDIHQDDERAWRDIFQQPIVYPPPDSHPIFRTLREP